ncbi:MAG TPA: hypothetical protein VK154_16065 [Chitinophagales bacterium]|nr:hypothetical protein [Chitinophagales bacterium]
MRAVLWAILFAVTTANAQNGVKIAATAGTADPSAMLDITSPNKGLLFPRVTLTGLTDNTTPVNNPATGLVVYNLGSVGVPATGIYFWNGSSWVLLSSGGLSGSGTTNQVSKWTASNALGNSIITDNGTNVGIGTASPNAKLTVGTALSGSALSSTFVTNAGSLGGTAGNILNLANFGFVANTNNTSLGIKALRASNGTDWTTSSIGLLFDVDNTSPVNNAQIWLSSAGNVGIGTTAPTAKLHIGGTSGTDGLRFPDGSLQKFASTLVGSYFAMTPTAIQNITSITPVEITGLSITITPKSASSKFLIMAVVNGTLSYVVSTVIYRNGANILSHGANSNEPGSLATFYEGGANNDIMRQQFVNYMDAPNTTAPVTYSIRHTSGWAGGAVLTQVNSRNSNDMMSPSTLTILEFAQ